MPIRVGAPSGCRKNVKGLERNRTAARLRLTERQQQLRCARVEVHPVGCARGPSAPPTGNSFRRGGPACAIQRPSRISSASTSSVRIGNPRATNAAPSVDFPYPQSPRNATASPSITTAVACSGSLPRDNSENDRTCPSRYVASDSSVAPFEREDTRWCGRQPRSGIRRGRPIADTWRRLLSGGIRTTGGFEEDVRSLRACSNRRATSAAAAGRRSVRLRAGRRTGERNRRLPRRDRKHGIAWRPRSRIRTAALRLRLAGAVVRGCRPWLPSVSGSLREPSAPARGRAASAKPADQFCAS